MSERRRRQRLRDKVRTLQELIPHCDKRDRASVLDDAIEYLKALKLQVQTLSASRGALFQASCIPPAGIPSAQVTQFSPLVPMIPTIPAIPMAGFCQPTGLPTMQLPPACLYPSLAAASTVRLHLNPANFPASAHLQAPCFPSEPVLAASTAALLSLTTCASSTSVSPAYNYLSDPGESSFPTTLTSCSDSQQVISTSPLR